MIEEMKLKPCPFCGKKETRELELSASVICRFCAAQAPTVFWNMRAESSLDPTMAVFWEGEAKAQERRCEQAKADRDRWQRVACELWALLKGKEVTG